MFNRFLGFSAVVVLLGCALTASAHPAPAVSGTVVLKFYDTSGNGAELSASDVKTVMHGAHNGSDSDALVDPSNLQDLRSYPLYQSGSHWVFDLPGRAAALAVNWVTDRGFSTVVLDDGGGGFTSGGTVVFNYQAALDARRRLDAALAARPGYPHSADFDTAYQNAAADLDRARSAGGDGDRGKYGQLALNSVDRAYGTLLAEYGLQYAKKNATSPWLGLTVDNTTAYPAWPSSASRLTRPHGWVRLVFDPSADNNDPAYYDNAVKAAHAAGLKVMGLPLDSHFDNGRHTPPALTLDTRAGALARVKKFVDHFADIEAWEIDNEVNGCWVDSKTNPDGSCNGTLLPANDRIKNKVADAAAYVRQKRPSAQVALTLYWQLGTDDAKWSAFNWARANLPASVRGDIDVVLLSTYVDDAPLGLATDQVLGELHAEFPAQRTGFGELGYWDSDTSKNYWAFTASDTAAARRQVAAQYYAAALGYPSAVGGGFWWYFVEDMPGDPGLQQAIRGVGDGVG